MATLRVWLTNHGFDWARGVIVYQPTKPYSWDPDASPAPGNADDDEVQPAEQIDALHPILDHAFDDGFGAPECPRIFARDLAAVYFPGKYDGATWLEKVYLDPEKYLTGALTPYVGGG